MTQVLRNAKLDTALRRYDARPAVCWILLLTGLPRLTRSALRGGAS
ncbi:MAG: hypothetical protein MJ164_02635 [Alphaproteobacteria bacterium]|nr:hypothetical protein [Alphaproteobacteria bacterium]